MDRSLMNRTITMYNDENIINTGDIMSSPDQFYKSVNSSSTAESDVSRRLSSYYFNFFFFFLHQFRNIRNKFSLFSFISKLI